MGTKLTEEQKKARLEKKLKIEQQINDAGDNCLPCPFCGDKPIIKNETRHGFVKFVIGCDCFSKSLYGEFSDVALYVHTEWFRDVQLAIEQWNRRKVRQILKSI